MLCICWKIIRKDNSKIEIENVEYTIEDRKKYGKNIPKECTKIGNGCFEDNKEMKEIVIPKEIKELGKESFLYCINLEKIIFEEGSEIKEIPEGCMKYCKKIETITLPTTIQKIKKEGFYYCSELKEIINLNRSIEYGESSFAECQQLIGKYSFLPSIVFKKK